MAYTREVAASVNQESKDDVKKVINEVKQKCSSAPESCSGMCDEGVVRKKTIVNLLPDNNEAVNNLEKLPNAEASKKWIEIQNDIMANTCTRDQNEDMDYLDRLLPEKENPHTRAFMRGDIRRAFARARGGKSKKRVKRTRKKGRIAIASGIRKRVRRMRTKIRRRRGNKSKRKI